MNLRVRTPFREFRPHVRLFQKMPLPFGSGGLARQLHAICFQPQAFEGVLSLGLLFHTGHLGGYRSNRCMRAGGCRWRRPQSGARRPMHENAVWTWGEHNSHGFRAIGRS